jgi:hypothetical protein
MVLGRFTLVASSNTTDACFLSTSCDRLQSPLPRRVESSCCWLAFKPLPRNMVAVLATNFFWVLSCLYMKLHSVPICTETVFIFQEILRASLMPVH